ncbi:MAG: type II toxin-antitoxin system VapC family toxin [Magnetococcales bacterium]|nr:type II toxin-antitoxin system VapC family toxin [Magnetococcales bacterium]
MTLIDTNILLDIVTDDPVWASWSLQQLDGVSLAGPLLINDVIYAELSVRFARIEELDGVVQEFGLTMVPMPQAALFLAGKVFQRYRAAGGTRHGVLPDFFIGAHAATLGLPLLTRDRQRYHTYFPSLQLVTPLC